MCWGQEGGSRESVCYDFLFPGDLHEVPELQLLPTEVGPPYCVPRISALLNIYCYSLSYSMITFNHKATPSSA